MATRRTARPAWAAALALLCGCSSETTTGTLEPEPAEVSSESEFVTVFPLGAEELQELSREEIWTLGVQQLRWLPEEPPEKWTKEMMIERFSVDAKYWDWTDRHDFPENDFRELGYTEDE